MTGSSTQFNNSGVRDDLVLYAGECGQGWEALQINKQKPSVFMAPAYFLSAQIVMVNAATTFYLNFISSVSVWNRWLICELSKTAIPKG
jgi:hypothetical protein